MSDSEERLDRLVRRDAPSERNFLREFEAKRGMGACICEGQEISAALDEIERQRIEIMELKQCLMDAIDWNWLDDDKPEELYMKYYALADA